jgi:tRNA U34 5-methylaminomethyl-2-thiouridine-forming methyltransferase MnmC
MKIEYVVTEDGSSSLYLPELDEHYHSSHGALQEARHVFIANGLEGLKKDTIRVFEMGFGTGLNALLSLDYAIKNQKHIDYQGIEAYPVDHEMVARLNYVELINPDLSRQFGVMHQSEWNERIEIENCFLLKKIHRKIEDYSSEQNYFDIIFFDAFGYQAQIEVWDYAILEKMHDSLVQGGMLVTYSARGQFKRDLKSLGFKIESLPGPPGKREMTRAIKL